MSGKVDIEAVRAVAKKAETGGASSLPWGLAGVCGIEDAHRRLVGSLHPHAQEFVVLAANSVLPLCAEVETLTAEVESLKELHRMQLCAIGVAALCNTPESAETQRIYKGNPYWTLAYSDVCAAVDREMALRASRDRLLAAVDEALNCDGEWWIALARAAERERAS